MEEALAAALNATFEEWATESLLAATGAYVDPRTGKRMKPATKVADDYQSERRPVAKRQLDEAGPRLALGLDDTLGWDR